MEESRNILSERLAAFLQSRLPLQGRDKLLAQKINVSPRTARNYLCGFWPGARQWRAIVREWGRDCVDAVFAPEINEVEARLDAEIRDLQEKLHARLAARRALVEGDQNRLAQTADLTAGAHAPGAR